MNEGSGEILDIGGNKCQRKPDDVVAVRTTVGNIEAITSILLKSQDFTAVSIGIAGHIDVYCDSAQMLAGRIGDYLVRDNSGYHLYEESNFLDKYDVFHNPEKPTQPQEVDK